ncbi:MAG: hydrogenase expression/formation protein HypE [bacterium]
MKEETILLSHGAGGRRTHDLISRLFLKHFSNSLLDELDDSAVLPIGADAENMVFTTDSYVVNPLFFPGGDIGRLAVCGTVNDLAVMGAEPKYLSCGFIIEEGFRVGELEKILESMREALREAGVAIVTGDTKVVEKGAADGVFINTSGVGLLRAGVGMGIKMIEPGDAILVNGTLGDHGLAVMAARESFPFKTAVRSDCAPLNGLVSSLLGASPGIRFMRDLTRGGLATVLNEIAESAKLGVELDEKAIPISESAFRFCEILGLDPLYLANEGKMAVVVPDVDAGKVLSAARAHPLGKDAAIIGKVTGRHPGRVTISTGVGGARILDMLAGDPLPRIC